MKRDYTTWEEDLFVDEAEFHDENDIAVGSVRRVGGSWVALYRGETIAIRPSKELAQKAVTDTHRECA